MAHWECVESHAVRLAELAGGDVEVARWFGIFHDAARQSEGRDTRHGERAAALVERYRSDLALSSSQIELLKNACTYHEKGMVSDDPTIGACWDADRLELPRVGIIPHPRQMSTPTGKSEASARI
ncbi:HD domain-containing protein [Deinococcus navajonensis]|uniref:HD domain-containing protein n=1 Tax=Deinococcus navajonensis TaxID=309884 RepID=A0ABV8XNC0_9DEIO